ncbi:MULTISPECIES: site-specific integrase [unclassified Colwellia]|jgi:integrase|uniref:site-specific integrase n=1 Tax=unclassified Colwellia TaxID=196834 RepID=UPI0015F3C5F5|nr:MULTISPECIES: site-specific integrase [unclassified Colwellia]MBA6256417.1 site-specific integrase [Colwellia sp. MB3u-28]MBA6260381.1 site-specific integrase [Colwellia sp. MB3u-41]
MKNVKDDKNKCDRKVIITPDKKTQNEGSDDIPFIIKLLERLLSSGKDKTHGICFFMFNSGFRFAEIIDLKFSDVDFIKGTLNLGRAKRYLPNKEKVSITLNHESLALLEKIRDKYPSDTWVFQAENGDDQRNKKHRSLSLQSVMNAINQNTEHKLSLNSFRHAYATSNFRNQLTSASIMDIKNNLGHETINTTINYIKN